MGDWLSRKGGTPDLGDMTRRENENAYSAFSYILEGRKSGVLSAMQYLIDNGQVRAAKTLQNYLRSLTNGADFTPEMVGQIERRAASVTFPLCPTCCGTGAGEG